MKTIIIALYLAAFILAASFNCAFSANPDRLYKKGQYKEALSSYEKLDIENPKDISYRYNKGCAAYQLKDFKTAQAAFRSVYQRAKDNNMRFKAAYNLGDTAFQSGDMQSSVSFYKEALRINPQSPDARYNLELALKKIKEDEDRKKQQQNQQDNKNQDKEDKNKQNQQDKNNKGNDKQKNQQDQKQKNQNGKDNEKQQPGQQQGQGRNKQQQPQQPQNLSGELKALNPAQQNKEGKDEPNQQQAKSPDKAKAEALLGNIQEDRSRFLQHQAPEDNQAPKSGKYW
jgi:Ca-activated chloride channel homolog